ncbi:MAG: hypothetical protein Q8891_15020 [Bacteroidota bacterium]|nr:hypothetical protein [Bacteroidota bacterium]
MKTKDLFKFCGAILFSTRLNTRRTNILFCAKSIFIIFIFSTLICGNTLLAQQPGTPISEGITIGSQRILFLDNSLIDQLGGKAELRLHHPVPHEIVLKCDEPWEGSGSLYFSIFKDGNLYRMYYRGVQVERFEKGHEKEDDSDLHNKICYAESKDGIHWYKPSLGIYDYKGSKDNSILLTSGEIGGIKLELGDNAAFFKDTNPNVLPDARYKALICAARPRGLMAFKSSDAIHWVPMSKELIITDGAFDSQNIAFWDNSRKEYRAYWRIFKNGVRDVRTAVSTDFIHWDNHQDLAYSDTLKEQLYTNQVEPYYRAPQLFIGFPTRYVDRGWSPSMRALPEPEYRERRSSVSAREGTAVTESLVMASTDGVNFKRWNEAFLRPGIERPGTWNYGQQYMSWGMLETKSDLAGAPNELSLYVSEEYKSQQPIGTRLRRYTLRLDGFVSVNAPISGGSLVTRPISFQGKQLSLNFSTSAAGSIQVEIQDTNGNPLPGFTLQDCSPVFGDTIERTVTWNNSTDVSSLAGKQVRLMFVLKDADLYSFQFQE